MAFTFCVILVCAICEGKSFKNWMAFLPDEIPVLSLAIPGTRDSGTFTLGPTSGLMYSAQSSTIQDQLQFGIRAFHFHVCVTNDPVPDMIVGIGAYNSIYYFSVAIQILLDFVEAHPTETCFVRIVPLCNSSRLEVAFNLAMSPHQGKFVVGTLETMGTLANVRRKVFFLNGTTISAPMTMDTNCQNATEFKEWINSSFAQIQQNLFTFRYPILAETSILPITVTDDCCARITSQVLNPKLLNWFRYGSSAASGIVLFDFADTELVAVYIGLNALSYNSAGEKHAVLICSGLLTFVILVVIVKQPRIFRLLVLILDVAIQITWLLCGRFLLVYWQWSDGFTFDLYLGLVIPLLLLNCAIVWILWQRRSWWMLLKLLPTASLSIVHWSFWIWLVREEHVISWVLLLTAWVSTLHSRTVWLVEFK